MWQLQTTDDFSHWYDPIAARAWIVRARELLARNASLNGAPYDAQRANVVDLWRSISNAYRAFNVSPHGDHVYRATFAQWIGPPRLNVPARPSFAHGEGFAESESLVWRVWEDPHEVPGAPGEPSLIVSGASERYVTDAVAMFRRNVDANWRGRADVVIRAGILDELGSPLFGCLDAPPGEGDRCSWEREHWPRLARYSWDSIAVGGRGWFQTLRLLAPLHWSVDIARPIVARFAGDVGAVHRELVLSTLVENVRTALQHGRSYRALQELAMLWPAEYQASRAGFGDALGAAVGRAALAASLASPLVGGIVAGAGTLLGRILESLGVPMAAGWNSDPLGYPAPRLIPAVVSASLSAQNRPTHAVPDPLPIAPLPQETTFANPYAMATPDLSYTIGGALVNLATPAQVAANVAALRDAPPATDSEEWHPVDSTTPTVQPTQEPPGLSTGTKIAGVAAIGGGILWLLSSMKRR